MEEGQDKKQEGTPVVSTDNTVVNEVKETNASQQEQEVRVVNLITDPQERMDAFNQLQILSNLINTFYFLPKLDGGNGNTQAKKITSSVQLNYFGGEQLTEWGAKIVELSERLGLNGKNN